MAQKQRRGSAGDMVVAACCRHAHTHTHLNVDEVFLKACGEVSVSQALLLMGNFNVPETCLQDGRTQAVRELSGGHQGQLLAAGAGGTSWGDAQLHMLFSSREELFSGRGNQ